MQHLGEVSSEKGNPYYVFDRGLTAKISECCRLSFKLDAKDLLEAKEPWRMRYCALQNVTLNLPRLAYLAKGDEATLFSLLTERFFLAVKAHEQKRAFMEKLLSYGENGPLSLLTMRRDGAPYLRLDRATHLVGMVGLNELVQQHTGEELHASKRALKFGLKVIAHLKLLLTERVQKEMGSRIVLEQTPAESTSYRFARLDYQQFFPASARIVKGDIPSGEIYYTNSTHLNVGVPINPIERVTSEGCFILSSRQVLSPTYGLVRAVLQRKE